MTVADLTLSLHDPEQSLNGFVVRVRVLAGVFHDVINGPFANAPQDLQQTKFCGRGKYQLLGLPDFPHCNDCATKGPQGQQPFEARCRLHGLGKHDHSCVGNSHLSSMRSPVDRRLELLLIVNDIQGPAQLPVLVVRVEQKEEVPARLFSLKPR
jgi:hypothetical protein